MVISVLLKLPTDIALLSFIYVVDNLDELLLLGGTRSLSYFAVFVIVSPKIILVGKIFAVQTISDEVAPPEVPTAQLIPLTQNKV